MSARSNRADILRYADGMTEQQQEGAPAGSERPIMFRGREMWVKFPSEEQIVVYSRTLKMLQGPEVEGWEGAQVLKALDRVFRIIVSTLVNRVDIEWIEDEMLDGNLKLPDACEILNQTVQAFGQEGDNRAAKRAAAPRKRAARRKATA